MSAEHRIRAALFDLDGTLVDTEGATDIAIHDVLAAHGIRDGSLPPSQTRGRTWRDVTATLIAKYQLSAAPAAIEAALDRRWLDLTERPDPIPGALAALTAAARHLLIGVVSSSERSVIDRALLHLGADALVPLHARIGAGDVTRTKPAPDPFLLAAARLGVAPAECVVFEDSSSGLTAARAAEMARVAVLHRAAELELCRGLADGTCTTYQDLPVDFWSALAMRGRAALGSYP